MTVCLILYTLLCIKVICEVLCISDAVMHTGSLEIVTTLGPIKGKLISDKITDVLYYSFEGIPYAEPPVGNLRFKPPVKKTPWTSVYDATKPGCVCPQVELLHSRQEMSEDCLNFNIYTPANYFNKLRPVIFYIHGGHYKISSGNAEPIHGPQLLILKKLVVVTINYRLGALGFLSLCSEEVSGNAGIKDVLLALKTVQNNIQRFGGDPKKITIVGNDAGAVIPQYLMLTNQSVGLFQSVMLPGGSLLSTKFTQIHPRQNAIVLGKELGLDLIRDDYMLEELRRVNAFDIIKAQEAIERRDPQRGFRRFSLFKPTVEIPCKNAIITRSLFEVMRGGDIVDIPMMIGFNSQQGLEIFPLLRKEPELIDKLNGNFELCIPASIQYPHGSAERRNLASRIREFYFGGGNISFVNVQNYVNLISDSQYTFAIDFFIKLFKEKKSAPVYYYVFETDTELNWFKKIENITYPGAGPNDGLGYLFLTSATKSTFQTLDSKAKKVLVSALKKTKYFLNYGVPTPNSVLSYWPEAGKERWHQRQGNIGVAIFHKPIPERLNFWYAVYEEYLRSTWWKTSTPFCINNDIQEVKKNQVWQ